MSDRKDERLCSVAVDEVTKSHCFWHFFDGTPCAEVSSCASHSGEFLVVFVVLLPWFARGLARLASSSTCARLSGYMNKQHSNDVLSDLPFVRVVRTVYHADEVDDAPCKFDVNLLMRGMERTSSLQSF